MSASLIRIARNPAVIGLVLAAVFLSILPLRDSEAVVNGPVETKSPSWTAFLFHGQSDAFAMCSGVLISENLVLSNRHCQGGNLDRVFIGSANPSLLGGSYRGIKLFEGYSGRDDIGVFVLNQPVDEKPIALSPKDVHLNIQVVKLFGYGVNSDGQGASIDSKLRSVEGMSAGCIDEFVDSATESEFCLRSQVVNQGPCYGDSGAPIVAIDGTLGAIYSGLQDIRPVPSCIGSTWRAVSVTTAPVRKWVAEMIDKYEVNDEL